MADNDATQTNETEQSANNDVTQVNETEQSTNPDSIFITIKKLIGFKPDYNAFDTDILIAINSALSILTQLGVGPEEGYRITGSTETWDDYLGQETINLEIVKDYIFLKVRHIFDPPASSSVMNAIENEIKEMEWRINVMVDPQEEESNV